MTVEAQTQDGSFFAPSPVEKGKGKKKPFGFSSAKHFPKVSVPFCRLPLQTLHSSTRACSAWEPVAVCCTVAAWVQALTRALFLRLHFQGAPRCTDLQSRFFANRKVAKVATSLPTRGRFFSDRFHSEDRSPLWELDIFPQFPRGCLQAS